jgi:ATP-binding cassette subfamily C protein
MASDSTTNPLHAALRACAGSFALVLAYSSGYNLLLLATPIYLLQLYDRVLSSRSGDTLAMLTLIVAVTVVVGGALDALRRAALARIGAWFDERIRPTIVATGLDAAARGAGGEALQLYRDVATFSQFLGSGACPMLFDLLWSPVFIVLLFFIHPLLGFFGILCIVVLFALALAGEVATQASAARVAAAFARSYSRLHVATANIDLVRALGMTAQAQDRILAEADAAWREQLAVQKRGEVVMLAAKPVRALSQILVMGLAAWLVLAHDKSPAIIFAASLLFGRGLAPVEGAIAGWKAFAVAVAAFRRMARAAAAGDTAPRSDALTAELVEGPLVLDRVSVALPGGSEPVLKAVSLRVEPGECLGVIGLSGSGKSMLARVIAGVLPPSEGRAVLGRLPVGALGQRGGAGLVGYMPQEIELVGRSACDIIGRLGQASFEEVVGAARLAGMHETIMRLPRAYESDLADGGLVLLRSHRQRLALARALCGRPRLVVLDEPNASLDYPGEQILFEAVRRLKAQNAIVVLITHRTGILAATDKIAILESGALAAFGPSEEIFARHLGDPDGSREPKSIAAQRPASELRKPPARRRRRVAAPAEGPSP